MTSSAVGHLLAAPDPDTDNRFTRCRVEDLDGPEAVDRVRLRLAADGLAILSGIAGRDHMLEVAAGLMRVVAHPHSTSDGMTELRNREDDDSPNTAGFTSRTLLPHTDRSGVAEPPPLLMTVCTRPAARGGSSVLVDGKLIHDELIRTAPDAVTALLRPGSVSFGGFCTSILTDVPEDDDAFAPARRRIRLRLDNLACFSPEVGIWLPHLAAAIGRHVGTVRLGAGEGYLLDNHRWLHGRTAFEGPRAVLRLLGQPLPETAFDPGIPVAPVSGPLSA